MDDMISRKAAKEVIRNKIVSASTVVRMWDMLDSVPAVDAAPVVHGRWVYKERHRKSYRTYTGLDAAGEEHTITVCLESAGKEPYCSNCGAQAAESFMDYCPNCGARMDGERRDDDALSGR